jgi:hypothetical protein
VMLVVLSYECLVTMTNVVVLQIFTSRLDEGNVLGFLDVISFGST